MNNKTWNPDLYQQTWNFACYVHLGQTVPGTQLPYANHLANVAMEVMTAIAEGGCELPNLAMQAALLHDSIEDTDTTYEQLLTKFGQAVADGVQALTKDTSLPNKAEQMGDSLARILQQPQEIAMVKLADRITNLQAPPSHWSAEKIEYYKQEAQMILQTLGDANAILAKRLEAKIENYPPNAKAE